MPVGRSTSSNSDSSPSRRPTLDAFPCLRLAREAARRGGDGALRPQRRQRGGRPLFLQGELPFTGIPEVIERTLEADRPTRVRHFSDLYRADTEAREAARKVAA